MVTYEAWWLGRERAAAGRAGRGSWEEEADDVEGADRVVDAAHARRAPGVAERAPGCRGCSVEFEHMADTASSVARSRCHSAPRQRHGHAVAPVEQALARAVSSKTAPQDSFSLKSSEATSRVE